MTTAHGGTGRAAALPTWVRVAVVPLFTAIGLLAGAWIVTGRLGIADRDLQIVAGIGWFVVMSLLLGRLGRARRDLRWPLRAAVWATAAVAAFGFYWTSVRDTVVDEDVARAAPAPAAAAVPAVTTDPAADAPAAGPAPAPPAAPAPAAANTLIAGGALMGLDGHDAAGTAEVIRLAGGGRVLTLTSFDVDPGPDILVYLTPDQTTTGGDIVDLGRLKGNRGDQQYSIPAGVDLGRHDTLVLWCRAFSVRVAGADLTRA